ncbi:hypothetical protein [Amycolatopsis sp. WAC 04182]|uniref:hypothetical protein n=1 Tax=Amycolatopsis sp. WAC 04182 TaxID=2203198 RepID=UPI000F76F2A9|nr:hypothetical protein [Amycolatopsis sp. WAC 04182]
MVVAQLVVSYVLLGLFCACVVVAIVRKEGTRAVLLLVGVMLLGVLAMGYGDPAMLQAAAEFVASLLR